MKKIVAVQALDHYRLSVRFEDGKQGEVDLSDLVGKGVFAAWKDVAMFRKVGVDPATGTVAWPGGIDLDPDQLYHDVTGAPVPGSLPATH